MKTQKYFYLPLNLQDGIIHTNQPNVTNTVCAFFNRHKDTIIIRLGYQCAEAEILNFAGQFSENGREFSVIKYGDGFRVDTWNDLMFTKQDKTRAIVNIPTGNEIREWAESHFPVLKKTPEEVTLDEMRSYSKIIPEVDGMIRGAAWMREQIIKSK